MNYKCRKHQNFSSLSSEFALVLPKVLSVTGNFENCILILGQKTNKKFPLFPLYLKR